MTQDTQHAATQTFDTQGKRPPRILVMAAGTGGHVFPALAVARELQARGAEVQWLATTHGMENRLLAKEDIVLHQVAIQGMRGNGLLRLLKTPFSVLAATLKAIRIIKAGNIDAVAGFGGYVAAPGGLAARLLGVPLIIHEQNAIAGMTNRYLARLATVVMEAFPNTFSAANAEANQSLSNKIQTVGNPVRGDILSANKTVANETAPTHHAGDLQDNNLQEGGVSSGEPTRAALSVLVIGGSLGAQVLNDTVPKAAALTQQQLRIAHQCGRGHLAITQANYKSALAEKSPHQVEVSEFISDMAAAYRAHDVLICRAGASTVSEVAATGMPAVFVPLPHAVDDHQTANARYLSDAGAAVLLPQSKLTAQVLADELQKLTQTDTRHSMSQKASAKAMLGATTKAADIILQYAQSA